MRWFRCTPGPFTGVRQSEGGSYVTRDRVRLDNLCDFGKWLYGADAATMAGSHYANINDLHARFHETAAADAVAM